MKSQRHRYRRVAIYIAEALLAGAITVHLAACSLLLPANAVRNNRRYPPGELAASRIGEVPGHPRIRIITAGGDTVAGRFGSIRLAPDAEYAERYRAWRANGHEHYPQLGETVRLDRLADRPAVQGRFLGFGARSIWLDGERMDDEEIRIETVYRMERANGLGPAADTLLAAAALNQLPSRAVVRLHLWPDPVPAGAERYTDREARRANIPLNEIQAVVLDSPVSSVAGALAMGVAMDATVVLVIASLRDRDDPPEPQGCSDPWFVSAPTP